RQLSALSSSSSVFSARLFFFFLAPRLLCSTLFPYTTLFRSLVVTFVVALVVDVFTITGFTVFTVVDGLVVAGTGFVVFVTFCDFTVEVLACAFSLTKAIVLIPIAVVTIPNTNFLLEKVRIFVFIFILFPLMFSIISIIHNIFSNTIIKLMFNRSLRTYKFSKII